MLALIAVVSGVALYTLSQSQLSMNIFNRETVFQVALFKPFAEGVFDGNTTYAELTKHGDFGIGTLNGLDGEMVALNGVFYQIPIDGKPRQINSTYETPFAMVHSLRQTKPFTLHVADAMNYQNSKLTSTKIFPLKTPCMQ